LWPESNVAGSCCVHEPEQKFILVVHAMLVAALRIKPIVTVASCERGRRWKERRRTRADWPTWEPWADEVVCRLERIVDAFAGKESTIRRARFHGDAPVALAGFSVS
jgi:hypothetical protein